MSSQSKTLTTDRLILRQFTMDDADALLVITQEPDIFQYFPTKTAWDMSKVERSIYHQNEHWRRYGFGQMAVTLRETGQLMGWCGLEFLPDTNETEVGSLLGHEFWGKGYATEAARASVEFGKAEIRLKEIIGLTDPLNVASQRVLENCGLVFTRRQVYFGMEMFRYSTKA
jgi:ribosomal-protein-alanine N-acetyltransferase